MLFATYSPLIVEVLKMKTKLIFKLVSEALILIGGPSAFLILCYITGNKFGEYLTDIFIDAKDTIEKLKD